MSGKKVTFRNPWAWVPSLYFAEGIPYVMVMTVSVAMYKKLGISNTDIAFFTSLLYLPWTIKFIWGPFVDMFKTKRVWIKTTQFLISITLFGVAATLVTSHFFVFTIFIFSLMAFASATHDIAADGFYMLALDESQQAGFVGIRSTFYRIATIAGQGLMVMLAGFLEYRMGNQSAWSIVFIVMASVFFILFVYHRFILPYPTSDFPTLEDKSKTVMKEFADTFALFFKKKEIWTIMAFLLLFRFAEAQLVKLVQPFLLDPLEKGGLGLSTEELGLVYGTFGVAALMFGGILGGILISKKGLKYWLWPMVIIMHTPDLVFVYLSYFQPQNIFIIISSVALEQFGYGFGFTAYMMYMIMISQGKHKTAHYAICTGIMALGMMLPGMFSGWLQDHIGYNHFFIWVLISTIPGFIVAALVKIDPEFGKKKGEIAKA
jgi:PAT family beta-lactamase induction signal transducer AmpG